MRMWIALACCAFVCSCKSKEEKKEEAPQEVWELVRKKEYSHKVNSLGKLDTTRIVSYNYKDNEVADSNRYFSVHRYNDDRLVEKKYFKLVNGSPVQDAWLKVDYDKEGRILSSVVTSNGKLEKSERYQYNSDGKISKYFIIQSSNTEQLPDELAESTAQLNKNVITYDTLSAVYGYDADKKVASTYFSDGRGVAVRRDTNIYNGNEPLATYTMNEKGDTLQRTEYKIQSGMLGAKIDTDSFTLYQSSRNGYPLGQITVDKTRREQWKKTIKYDVKGRKSEEALYKLVQ